MAVNPEGLIFSIAIILAAGILVVALTNRMRIALEMIILFALSNIFLILSINTIKPESSSDYILIAMFPALFLVYGGLRFNQLFKQPYTFIVESSKRIWNNDLTLIHDDVAQRFTGEMLSLYNIHRGLIKKYNEILSNIASSSTGISRDGTVLFTDADTIIDNFSQTTDDVDKILQSVVVLSDLIDNIKTIIQQFLNDVEQKFNEIGFSLNSADRITDQTNLIAVNASIEAAHTGKEGENFGIVAESIQSLSQRSRSSTNDLIQNSTELNNIIKNRVDHVLNEINQIDDLIYQIGELSNNSSTLSHKQQSTADNLVKLANSIKEQAEQTHKIVEKVTF